MRSKWARCGECLRHYNLSPELDYAYPVRGSRSKEDFVHDMAKARAYFKWFHEQHVGATA